MIILNLTQHKATTDQIEAGVVDLNEPERLALIDALTFDSIPSQEEIERRANYVADLATMNNLGGDHGDDPFPAQAMVGGAPWLMSALEKALLDNGVEPVYAFSVRESVETVSADGSVVKKNIFRHVGFVEVSS